MSSLEVFFFENIKFIINCLCFGTVLSDPAWVIVTQGPSGADKIAGIDEYLNKISSFFVLILDNCVACYLLVFTKNTLCSKILLLNCM